MNKKELTWRIRVYGIVQGVGFRPTVSRHATSNGICGTVCNKGPYVEIYAQGQKKQMEGFLKALEVQPPKRAAILKINTEDVTAETDMRLILLKVKRPRERSLFRRILRSAKNVRKKCMIQRTGGICIHLSTVPAVDQDLPFWMRCPMTGNGRA